MVWDNFFTHAIFGHHVILSKRSLLNGIKIPIKPSEWKDNRSISAYILSFISILIRLR